MPRVGRRSSSSLSHGRAVHCFLRPDTETLQWPHRRKSLSSVRWSRTRSLPGACRTASNSSDLASSSCAMMRHSKRPEGPLQMLGRLRALTARRAWRFAARQVMALGASPQRRCPSHHPSTKSADGRSTRTGCDWRLPSSICF